ncbi:hypothetical protein NMA510612_1861 [Neisseria meningitidis]|uniref:Uncharacterized protein n=1 Tax=Neisseria meningitidis TaxID=487 RepID=X5ESX8_NEIME|nr:hypothetical protein NMA510612_1861 [Neisseria meningitidis]
MLFRRHFSCFLRRCVSSFEKIRFSQNIFPLLYNFMRRPDVWGGYISHPHQNAWILPYRPNKIRIRLKKKTKKTDTPISAEPTVQAHKQTLSTIRHTIYNFLFQKE